MPLLRTGKRPFRESERTVFVAECLMFGSIVILLKALGNPLLRKVVIRRVVPRRPCVWVQQLSLAYKRRILLSGVPVRLAIAGKCITKCLKQGTMAVIRARRNTILESYIPQGAPLTR